ncbi:Uncharacterized conserved protein [Microbacterium sp. cf046]|uniref:YciI family protein n=1 Tax=Microbacterium sp. cf046 TaxID=1761803 RepID=UPI0008F1DE35|nr:YciI family protein [Microbacterium sp. cf046]SFS17607.1 Uncharacterized conserved protein [Microbacterium sp. cf046]
MKYLILINSNPAVVDMFAGMTEDERRAQFQIYWDVENDLEESGELVDSTAIDEATQRAVRRGDDGVVVTDVPPPTTGSVVTGYYLVDVDDEARAVEIAARFPEAVVDGGIRVARALTQEDFDAIGM